MIFLDKDSRTQPISTHALSTSAANVNPFAGITIPGDANIAIFVLETPGRLAYGPNPASGSFGLLLPAGTVFGVDCLDRVRGDSAFVTLCESSGTKLPAGHVYFARII